MDFPMIFERLGVPAQENGGSCEKEEVIFSLELDLPC